MRVLVATGFYPGEKMGGAEYQTSLIAQGLVARGHQAGFLATGAGVTQQRQVEGVSLWEIPGWHTVGYQRHQAQLAQVVEAFAPDLCYVRVFSEIDNVMQVCRKAQIPVISVSCGPQETSPFLLGQHPKATIGHLRSRELFYHFRSFLAIRSAAVHICNSQAYSRTMQRWYPKQDVRTIYNGSPVPTAAEIHREPSGQVIWVNNCKRAKRPELFIELARRLPQYNFVMIGATYGRYGDSLKRKIEQGPSNLHYLGPQPIMEVNRQISQSDLLVYTTAPGNEGFGNSYMQAWFRAVPTLSTFELDGILDREGIGHFAHSFDQLVAQVRELMTDHEGRMAMGARARDYAMRCHRVETMVDNYEALFTEVAQRTVGQHTARAYAGS